MEWVFWFLHCAPRIQILAGFKTTIVFKGMKRVLASEKVVLCSSLRDPKDHGGTNSGVNSEGSLSQENKDSHHHCRSRPDVRAPSLGVWGIYFGHSKLGEFLQGSAS